MLSLILYPVLFVILTVLVRRHLSHDRERAALNYHNLKQEFQQLEQEDAGLVLENASLEKAVAETMALYDITKDLRKVLDEERIFKLFKERIRNYVQLEECLYLKGEADPQPYAHQTLLPLRIEKNTLGHLVAVGLKEKDKEKFNILAHQFLSAAKGALLFKQVQDLAIIDSLTHIFNRRYFVERLEEEIRRSRKFNHSFTFAMVDVDHFKDINDKFGHLVGDAILREVVQAIKENIRQIDFMGRFGGEELSLVFTETEGAEAREAAERIRRAIGSRVFQVYDEQLMITVSIGLSLFPGDSAESTALIEKADKALYQAKEQGRNRVCVYGSSQRSNP